MLPCSKPGHLYCIDLESYNAGVPYADSFYVQTHYCMTSVPEGGSNLRVYSQVKYRKSVWGLVKGELNNIDFNSSITKLNEKKKTGKSKIYIDYFTGFIEKNCYAGMEDYLRHLIKALSVECEESNLGVEIKRKARRRRRLTGATTSPVVADHLQSPHQAVAADLPRVYSNNGEKKKENIFFLRY